MQSITTYTSSRFSFPLSLSPSLLFSSVRRNLEQFDHINYIFAKNYSTYWETSRLVEDAILNKDHNNSHNRTILFYEIHATDSPSFYKLRERLKRWKDTAQRNKVPTFFFTLIRNPISYAFSHFNFFHIQYRNPTFEQVTNVTESEFLRLTLQNPQCQFLWKGEPSMRAQTKIKKVVEDGECDLVHSELIDKMDWIGTTDNMSNTTLPLLASILNIPDNYEFQHHKVTEELARNNRTSYISSSFGIENVTSETIEIVNQRSIKDFELYETAIQSERMFSDL